MHGLIQGGLFGWSIWVTVNKDAMKFRAIMGEYNLGQQKFTVNPGPMIFSCILKQANQEAITF